MFLMLALLCVLMTALTPVTSTSDPMAELCDTACWEEGVLVDQCITNLTCDVDSSISDAEFEACRQPCWDIAAPCRQQCRQWYHGALRRCSTSTGGRDSHNRLCAGWRRRFPGWAHHGCDGSTFMDCVLDFMMRSRARWLISSTRREQ